MNSVINMDLRQMRSIPASRIGSSAASITKWKSYTPADKQRVADEGNAAYEAILAAMPKGASSPEAQAGVVLWRKHMDYYRTPNLDQLVGLAEMYNDDPRFKANFDKIDPRLVAFMLEAVKVYAASVSFVQIEAKAEKT